ncbi:hypothetical protein [Psychrobacillus sp. BM2]|uniref:hypothetical protein n=1 Tax=Psychrobacillus sp. BM2 TaxID=3400421 RepID=UPI003B0205EF
MKRKQIQKRFNELVEHSEKDMNDTTILQMEDNQIKLMGIIGAPEQLNTGIILIQKENGLFIKGKFDQLNFNYSSISGLNNTDTLYIGVDNRDLFNHLIYLKQGEYLEYFNSKTQLDISEKLYLYWETDKIACLTICGFDPFNYEVVREVSYALEKKQIQLLQVIMRHAIISNNELTIYTSGEEESYLERELDDYDYE